MDTINSEMKKKLNFIARVRKEILKAFLRIYYSFETFLLRLYLFKLKRKIINYNLKISLLCPTKNRYLKFKRFVDSLINTTFYINRIELLICFDSYENEIEKYDLEILKLTQKGMIVKKYFKDLTSHALRNNYLAKKCSGDIIFPINDDMVFITNNWDKVIEEEFSRNLKSKPLCVWINCDRKYKKLDYSAFPVINYAWYKRLGYIVPEIFRFWYLDWWICEVSRISKKYFLSKVYIHQFHAETYSSEIDETYKQNATSKNLEHDYKMWLKTKHNRIQDSLKINQK